MISVMERAIGTLLISTSIWFAVQSCSVFSPFESQKGPSAQTTAQTASSPATSLPAIQAAPTQSPSSQRVSGPPDFVTAVRTVAEAVKPAVVQITTSQQVEGIFSRGASQQQTGVGSGVIYDPKGYIVTNNHVVAGADSLSVSLSDGRSFDAKLVGADTDTDLAVIQVTADNLPVAQLGDSAQLAVGEWVVAIGNALALPGGPTVTAGVIGALGRTVQEPSDQQTGQSGPFLYDLIQTDAAINPGNSGGALVNLQGHVVGINTLVAGTAEPGVQAQGIGFAIAINSAKPIAEQLVSAGKVIHPYIGVQYTALTPSVAARLGLKGGQGIVVIQVIQGSPAAQAGLRGQDVIKQIDNQPITDESTLGRSLTARKPGDSVTLTVERGGQTLQVKVTLGQKPSP